MSQKEGGDAPAPGSRMTAGTAQPSAAKATATHERHTSTAATLVNVPSHSAGLVRRAHAPWEAAARQCGGGAVTYHR